MALGLRFYQRMERLHQAGKCVTSITVFAADHVFSRML